MTPRRPRDRRRQIVRAAAHKFRELGYHQTGMGDIATEVGIAPSSLYRHFPGKQDLLFAAIDEALSHLERALGRDSDPLAAMVDTTLERREFGALWDRESGHLSSAERNEVGQRLQCVHERIAEIVPDRSAVRARAICAAVASVAYHHVPVSRVILCGIVDSLLAVELPVPAVSVARIGGRDPQRPVSRREALIAAAIRLFAAHGYASVSLNDLGAAAGVAGPHVYSYFASKDDLLLCALHRGSETLWQSLHEAMAAADGPADALARGWAAYTTFACTNPDNVTILLAETLNLPAEPRVAFRRDQLDYVAELVALLGRSRPELTQPVARVLVRTALGVVNTLCRADPVCAKPEVEMLSKAVLAHVTI